MTATETSLRCAGSGGVSVLHFVSGSVKLQNMDGLVLAAQIAKLRAIGSDTTTVEVKAAARGLPHSIGETISAFANGSGGSLILGLAESDGFRPAPGFSATRIRDALARVCHEDMEPPVRSDIEIVEFEQAQVVTLSVPPLDPVL
jgi:ATP-dependent DNA helicase RecG